MTNTNTEAVEAAQTSAIQLEADMRRYVYDKTPERRLKCLDQHSARMAALSTAKTEPYQRGDTVLIWVNEADLCPLTALSAPTRERELLVFLAGEMRAQEDCNTGRYDEWLSRIDALLNEGSGHE